MFLLSKLPNALPGEKIIIVVRKSIFVFLKEFILTLILLVIPGSLLYMTLYTYPGLLNGQISWPLIVLSVSAYSLFIWIFLFFSFLDYYLDVWIITDQRIIDIRQDGFFSRTISEQNIEKVQDVSSEIKGAFHTIINFGNIYVQTAGAVERVSFEDVPDPNGIRETIMELVENHKCQHSV